MLHIIGVIVLLVGAGIALTQKKEKRFPIVIGGAITVWVLIVTQLILEYL